MKEHQKRALMMLAMLVMTVILIALMPRVVNILSGDSAIVPYAMPEDLCIINGKPLTPEIDAISYSNPSYGIGLKYINQEGDLVLIVGDEIKAIYEGDFCHE